MSATEFSGKSDSQFAYEAFLKGNERKLRNAHSAREAEWIVWEAAIAWRDQWHAGKLAIDNEDKAWIDADIGP